MVVKSGFLPFFPFFVFFVFCFFQKTTCTITKKTKICYITKSMVVKSGQENRPTTRTKISNKIGLGGNKTQIVSKLIILREQGAKVHRGVFTEREWKKLRTKQAEGTCVHATCVHATCVHATCVHATCVHATCVHATCVHATCVHATCVDATCVHATCTYDVCTCDVCTRDVCRCDV